MSNPLYGIIVVKLGFSTSGFRLEPNSVDSLVFRSSASMKVPYLYTLHDLK